MKTWLDALFTHEHIYAPSGERVEDTYKVHYDKNGVRSLVKDGKKNTYDEIQSHAESVDIEVILKRFAHGDLSALGTSNPLYIDTTEMPDNYAEWFDMVQKSTDYFNSLAPDIRAQFNNSVEQFLASTWNGAQEVEKAVEKAPESEVTSSES